MYSTVMLKKNSEKKKVLQTLSFCLWPTCFKNKAQSSKFSGDKFAKYMHGPLFQLSDNCFDFFKKKFGQKYFPIFILFPI